MNILPKKRWHVRTKDNIARVRKDKALAAEEEKKKQLRIQIAEREKRREELRKKARERTGVQIPQSPPQTTQVHSYDSHINLFYELEQNKVVSNKSNKEYEKEKQLEKEKYEKQIGYLTYLGQDTNEITGKISWYNKPKEELHAEKKETAEKQKFFEDPLVFIRKYLGCEGIQKIQNSKKSEGKVFSGKKVDSETSKKRKKEKKKHKKHKKKRHKKRHSSTESEESDSEIKKQKVDLEKLRAERIKREKEERRRANELFAKLNGVTVKEEEKVEEATPRYNSQFNPHLAKQNILFKGL